MRSRWLIFAVLLSWAGLLHADPDPWTLKNPGSREHRDELVRLPIRLKVPFDSTRLQVFEDGRVVPHQVEIRQGSPTAVMSGDLWVRTTLGPGASHAYRVVTNAEPTPIDTTLKVVQDREGFLMSNGLIEVELPPETTAPDRPPGPILGVRRTGGKWLTRSLWRSSVRCLMLQPRVVARGPLFAEVELLYFFADPSYEGRIPFAAVTVRVNAGESIVRITESHDMYEGDHWLMNVASGLTSPRYKAIDQSGRERGVTIDGDTRKSLAVLAPRSPGVPDADEAVVVADEDHLLAFAPDAGPWDRPKDNRIDLRKAEKSDDAVLDLGTWRGDRAWVLFLGAASDTKDVRTLLRSATTDSLNHLIHPPRAK